MKNIRSFCCIEHATMVFYNVFSFFHNYNIWLDFFYYRIFDYWYTLCRICVLQFFILWQLTMSDSNMVRMTIDFTKEWPFTSIKYKISHYFILQNIKLSSTTLYILKTLQVFLDDFRSISLFHLVAIYFLFGLRSLLFSKYK
jgi:hypothetical protein